MEAKGNLCLCLTGTGGVAEVKEDSVCVWGGLGASKQGKKYGCTFPPLFYTWVCSPSGMRDRVLHSPCRRVGKVLPSPGVPCCFHTGSGHFSPVGFGSWLPCWGILLTGTFFLTSIQGGQPGSLATGETWQLCVFTAPRQKVLVWKNADSFHFRQYGRGKPLSTYNTSEEPVRWEVVFLSVFLPSESRAELLVVSLGAVCWSGFLSQCWMEELIFSAKEII